MSKTCPLLQTDIICVVTIITEDFNKRIFSSEETEDEKEFLIKEVRFVESFVPPPQAQWCFIK